MRPLKLVSLSTLLGFSLAACNSINTVGEWEGECELTTEGYAYDLEFEFDIEDEKGGRISGEGAYLYQGYIFDGELSGSRNGTDVEITLEGEYGRRESGIGTTNGTMGILNFCQPLPILTDRFGTKEEAVWYPYTADKFDQMKKAIKVIWGSPVRWLM